MGGGGSRAVRSRWVCVGCGGTCGEVDGGVCLSRPSEGLGSSSQLEMEVEVEVEKGIGSLINCRVPAERR